MRTLFNKEKISRREREVEEQKAKEQKEMEERSIRNTARMSDIVRNLFHKGSSIRITNSSKITRSVIIAYTKAYDGWFELWLFDQKHKKLFKCQTDYDSNIRCDNDKYYSYLYHYDNDRNLGNCTLLEGQHSMVLTERKKGKRGYA